MSPETMGFPKPLWPLLRLLQRAGSPVRAGKRVAFLACSPQVRSYTGEYWQQLALREYRGGPFADRSGGLITFDAESLQRAEQLVSGDPFLRERLLDRHSLKEWITDTGPPQRRQGAFESAAKER